MKWHAGSIESAVKAYHEHEVSERMAGCVILATVMLTTVALVFACVLLAELLGV